MLLAKNYILEWNEEIIIAIKTIESCYKMFQDNFIEMYDLSD